VNDQPHRTEGSESERRELETRRLARRSWPIRRYALGEEPPENLSATTSADQRLAMVWPLTVLSWRLAGLEIPDYERRRAPGVVRRSAEAL